MELTLITLSIFSLIGFTYLIYLTLNVKSSLTDLEQELLKGLSPTPPDNFKDDSSIDAKVLERDRELDQRMEQLKREIDEMNENHSTPADILHPGVVNLPHNDNKIKQNPFDVEVAE